MPGKNPHRPEGKAKADNEHMQAAWMESGAPHRGGPSDKALHEMDMDMKERAGAPGGHLAEEPVGGSRPGVESRVRDAIERREAREPDEEG